LAATALFVTLVRGAALALVYPLCAVAAIVLGGVDLHILLTGAEATARLPIGLPTIGLHLRLDALSAFFGLVINSGVLAASIYGMGFDRTTELTPRVEPLFPLFAAAMNLVLIADDAYAFLFSWELMSLASWALVVARHADPESRRAAHLYLVMAAIGTAALLFAFGGLAGPAGGYAFDTVRAHPPQPTVAALVLVAALVGCGSKSGLIPLHAWLPLAHSAAPSHVSALMSGVMTKVAVYGFVRIAFDLLGPPAWWWALPLITVGAMTTVLGLLYAVLDRDLKRVLAYSTIENVGVIFVALGFALAFRANGQHEGAAVAMSAALLHTLNHSWFKSLLFLSAGAVLHATGRRDLDGLGGLIHRMPRTAAFFLVGALAASALPPLNGFVSEWLLFQAVIAAPMLPQAALHFASPAIGAMLALAAALAAACFVRVYGTAFLEIGRAHV
jgi:formate hydrogenlyase subunit 3/multisubunit Na+/H+ antiporter MnhD subunit